MSRRKRMLLIVSISLLVLFGLATVWAHFANDFALSMSHAYHEPRSRSVETRQRGDWVADFEIEPKKVARDGNEYEFDEAWLEAAHEPSYALVWFPRAKRTEWSYLCIRSKTGIRGGKAFFEVTPKYRRRFSFNGWGAAGNGFTSTGVGDAYFYFQKVPTDLLDVELNVSILNYGKGADVEIGTAKLTRIK